jgi:hypothetical protein
MSMQKYSKSVHVFDNFFKNPTKVMELGDRLIFESSEIWPGRRTKNLLEINDSDVVEFAKFFAKKLADEVFYGIKTFQLDLRFHKYDIYDVKEANCGWIHNDETNLAGLVYLNPAYASMKTGTSIFDKISMHDFNTPDFESRKELNLNKTVTDRYLQDLKNNHKNFTETINVGNKFNRLIAYDAELWHRPNNYIVDNPPRYSLLFFINNATFEETPSLLSIRPNWRDE